jgi:hypothetical protein
MNEYRDSSGNEYKVLDEPVGENKHIQQIGKLVLDDGDGICVVSSDLAQSWANSLNKFEIRNPDTGHKYMVSIKIKEIK